jgi:sterol desaturase/sphingolipid hydroxylase (fatty acid hydroxylase superfamily)
MHDFFIEVLRLAAWLLLLVVIFVPLERVASIERQPIFRKQFAVDLGYYAINSVLTGALLALPLAIIGAAVHRAEPTFLIQAIKALPFWATLILSVLVAEIGFYWGHRLTHRIPFLWRFHAIHHSAATLDFLSNTRAHPVDIVFVRLCGFAPLFALGLAGGIRTPAIVIVLGTIWGFFIHANLRWRFGLLESIVATPFFHHWHHTNDSMRDRNYAAMLPLVDLIFGTLHLPKRWPTEYGIDTAMPPSMVGQIMSPFTRNTTP